MPVLENMRDQILRLFRIDMPTRLALPDKIIRKRLDIQRLEGRVLARARLIQSKQDLGTTLPDLVPRLNHLSQPQRMLRVNLPARAQALIQFFDLQRLRHLRPRVWQESERVSRQKHKKAHTDDQGSTGHRRTPKNENKLPL